MKVFVEVACELDPELNLRVDRTSGEAIAEDGDVTCRICPAGSAAIDLAIELCRAQAQRGTAAVLIAFAIGPGHREALVAALARGADSAVELDAVSPSTLAEWLREGGARLLVMGRLAGPVAACLGWAHLAGLDNVALAGDRLRAQRCLGRGDREEVEADLPAAIRLEPSRRPRYLARARVAAARSRSIEHAQLSGEGRAAVAPAARAGALAPARARTRLGAAAAPAPVAARGSDRLQALLGLGATRPAAVSRPVEEVPATPEAMAESFVRYLAHHHLIPNPG